MKFNIFCLLLFISLTILPVQPAVAQATSTTGIHLLRSDATGIVVELNTPDYSMATAQGLAGPCQQIAVPGYSQAGAAGLPQLPEAVTLIGLPPTVPVTFTVTALESSEIALSAPICPAPAAVVQTTADEITGYNEEAAAPDATVYKQALPYPATLATLQEMGFMRSQRIARIAFRPFQMNPLAGTLLYHRRLQVQISFGRALPASSTVNEEASQEQTLAQLLLNYSSARNWRQGERVQAAAVNGWRPPQNAYRIRIEAEGLYVLSYADLAAAGFPVNEVIPANLRMFYNGQETPILVTGADDGHFDQQDQLLFYGAAIKDQYTHTNSYWLTYGTEPGKRMKTSATSGQSALNAGITQYRATVRREQNLEYVSSLPMLTGYDHWYDSRITVTGAGNRAQHDYPLQLDQLVGGTATATIDVGLAGNVKGTHHARLLLNGRQVYEARWNGRTFTRLTTTFFQDLLVAGENTLQIELVNDTPNQVVDMVYVDWVQLRYDRKLVAQQDQLSFDASLAGLWTYTVTGFSNNTVEVYDITNPSEVRFVPGSVAQGSLVFSDSQPTARRYLALTVAQRRKPLSIVKVASPELLAPANGANYLIIAHPDFLTAVEPLAQYRRQQGFQVRVVSVEDIYNQFNFGRVSAQSIHDFLAYAYERWPAPKPHYVLLVGDGNYDLHGYLPNSSPNFIPPYLEMVDPVIGETASDNRYATVAGNDLLPDLQVGRFPARNVADVTAMVSKTLRYEQGATTQGASWEHNLIFATDNLIGGGGPFYEYSDAVADGLVQTAAGSTPLSPANYQKVKLYLGDNCPTESPAATCRQRLIDQMNQGALLVSYIGHAAKQYWAEEQLLNEEALTKLNNKDRLPIMLPMTCLEGFFHEPEPDSSALGETIVRLADNGAVASWSPTGLGLVSGHDYLEQGFFRSLFLEHQARLGDVIKDSQLYLLANAPSGKYDDLLDTFVLFGDPALRIRGVSNSNVYLPFVAR
jgi:hypothetical protein